MSRMLIIPFFIPFKGCKSICVFCDQTSITGVQKAPTPAEITERIELYLASWKGKGRREAAFYGGTFTALKLAEQEVVLTPAEAFLRAGRIDGIRVSTRPDCISLAITSFLSGHGVDTVELGVQSMDNAVLAKSNRGHNAEDTVKAVSLLREAGMKTGLQIMPGLPGDDKATALATARAVIALKPDFVRVYPTVVLKNTALSKMTLAGAYRPWSMKEMVGLCADITVLFEDAGIRIIRMGLQHTTSLEQSVVAGPYHPSFRDLVRARMPGGGQLQAHRRRV